MLYSRIESTPKNSEYKRCMDGMDKFLLSGFIVTSLNASSKGVLTNHDAQVENRHVGLSNSV